MREAAPEAAVSIEAAAPSAAEARRAVDPVSLATLVLTIPAAVLAVMDIADRLTERLAKRRRAETLLDRLRAIEVERSVRIRVETADGDRGVADLDPDALLDLASRRDR